MTLHDMILDTTISKEDYLLEFKKYNFQDILKTDITQTKPIYNRREAKDFTHSLFSLAFFSLNSVFIEAFNETFKEKIKYGMVVMQYNNNYGTIPLHDLLFSFLNDKGYFSESNDKFKQAVFKLMDSFSYYMHNSTLLFYKNEGYRSDKNLKRTDFVFRLGVHNQSLPVLCFMHYCSMWNPAITLEYLAKKCTLPEIKQFLYAFENHSEIIKKELSRTIKNNSYYKNAETEFMNNFYSFSFLFDMINGFTKKTDSDFVAKIDFILEAKPQIIKKLEGLAKKLEGKKDIEKIIDTDKEKKYVMAYAIIKDQHHMINRLLDYGYKLNQEELTLLLSHPVKDRLNSNHQHLLESDIDELAIMVKEFEKNLFKVSPKNIKNLNTFLDSLSVDKKDYLFSYYDQFQETSMALYRTDSSYVELNVNDPDVSAIDYCLFRIHYDYVDILLKHKFPFSREQIYKIGSYVPFFDKIGFDHFAGDPKELEKSFLNFLETLDNSTIKTIFLRNSSNNLFCGESIIDYFCQHILVNIKLNHSDIDVSLTTNNCNIALLDKIIKENEDYFFNKKTMINFLKASLKNSSRFSKSSYLSDYKSYPLPQTLNNIFTYILRAEPEYFDEMTRLLKDSSVAKQIFVEYEKNNLLNQVDKNEVDKVRIRRRI